MIPKRFTSCDAILSEMTEESLKILRNHIDNKLEKIEEERRVHLDELGYRLANIVAEIQAEKREVTITVCDEFGDEVKVCIGSDCTVAIRVE